MPFPLRTFALTAVVSMSAPAQRHDWPVYLGDKATTHYSTLDQINKQNVSRLREVWNYDTGEAGEFQSNGLVIDGVLYTATTRRKVLALNAATESTSGHSIPPSCVPAIKAAASAASPIGRAATISGSSRERALIFTRSMRRTERLSEALARKARFIWARQSRLTAVRRRSRSSTLRERFTRTCTSWAAARTDPGAIRAYDVRTGRVRWIFH